MREYIFKRHILNLWKYKVPTLLLVFMSMQATSCNGMKSSQSNDTVQVSVDTIKEQELPKPLENIEYVCSSTDSTKIITLLEGAIQDRPQNLMIYFARKLLGIPYVAHTLEVTDKEQLVVNLHELDCTTYVESCVALSICASQNKTDFYSYVDVLRQLRYHNGKIVDYSSRLHYFTEWIEENTKNGFVTEVQEDKAPFTAIQTIDATFMTSNPQYYVHLKDNPEMIEKIRSNEDLINGKKYRYIPKSSLRKRKKLQSVVNDGDIIAILTSKKGLDTSHLGIAVWHDDGLHLLNASSLKRNQKTVEENQLFYSYMDANKSNIGIRVIRLNKPFLQINN